MTKNKELKKFLMNVSDVEIKSSAIGDDENLIDLGIVDSMVILRLLAYMEEKYGILCSEDELNEENFATIENMNKLIEHKLNALEA